MHNRPLSKQFADAVECRKRSNRAFSLIECMISLLLSSWLCILIIQHIGIAQHNTQKNQQTVGSSYDKAMLSDLLRHRIQQAGFTPCRTIHHLSHTEPLQAIQIGHDPQPTLRISRMEEKYSGILEVRSPTSLIATSNTTLHNQDKVLIVDCFHAEQNQISGIRHFTNYTHITLQHPLQKNYLAPTYIGKWLTETFYLAQDKQGNHTLYYQSSQDHPEVLNQNIAAWRIHQRSSLSGKIVTIFFTMRDTLTWKLQSTIRA